MLYQYQDSGIDWIGQFPIHWKINRIKQRIENIIGGEWGSDPSIELDNDSQEIVVLRVADFDDIYLKYDNPTFRAVKRSKIHDRLLNGRSLILEKSGGGEKQLVGRVAEPKNLPFEAITSNFIARIELDSKVDRHFMNYLFNDLYNSNLNFPFIQQTTGIQNINTEYYTNIKVAIPPKPEQSAIADYLDKVCCSIDKAINIKEEQINIISQQLKSVILELITGTKLPENKVDSLIPWIGALPQSWRITKFKLILEKINSGVTPKGGSENYQDSGVMFFRSQNIQDFYLDQADIAYISSETHAEMSNSVVRKGDVLLNITGASLGRCHYYFEDQEANVNQHVCILRPSKKILSRYLHLIMISEIGQSQIKSSFTGSGREGLSFRSIKNFILPLPSLPIQQSLVENIDRQIEKNKTLLNLLNNEISRLRQFKKSLIHEVVTGKKQVYGLT